MSKTRNFDNEKPLKKDRPRRGRCDECGHRHSDDVLCPSNDIWQNTNVNY